MSKKHPLHDEVGRLIKKYKKLFGLPAWPVFFKFEDNLKGSDGETLAATCHVVDTNREVRIAFNSDLKPDATERTVAHEMAHWLLDAIDSFVCDVLPAGDVGKRLRAYWGDRLLEQAVEGIALAIIPPRTLKKAFTNLKEKHND